MRRTSLFVGVIFLLGVGRVWSAAGAVLDILYLKQQVDRPPVLSNLLEIPADAGLAGARLATKDSNTTGRFTGQRFLLQELSYASDEPVETIVQVLQKSDASYVLLDLPASTLEAILQRGISDRHLLFNVAAPDDHLRSRLCHKRLLHTLPSRSMLADALTQYLVKKRWVKWLLIEGALPGDRHFADALRRAAKKFGARIVEEKRWDGARDARRTAQAEVPRLTQGVDYDVLMVADEWGDFGEYLMYRTWSPRPVAGTQGLFPTAWYWTIEQWGGAQLQSRFKDFAGRAMSDRDYAAWAAVRSVSEGATRTGSLDFHEINRFIQSDDFELAGYKGRKLSYRPWSGQLRQPVAVTSARSLVSQSPQNGYLHRRSELDTLGFDQPEVSCKRN